jgi:hypothetical protein
MREESRRAPRAGMHVMGIIWIASYPKSGNTWMRFLLANYFAGPIEKSEQVEVLIPDFTRRLDLTDLLALRPVVYSKTHYVWGPRHPFAGQTDRSIIIIRHPKDVLLSNLNFRRLDRGSDQSFTDQAYIRSFIQYGGDPEWTDDDFGTLESNVKSWLDTDFGPERMLIRYEEMKSDIDDVLRRVIAFLQVPLDEPRLAMAISRSSFQQMRAIEVREKTTKKASAVFAGSAPRPGWHKFFMNEGKTRGSLKHLGDDLDHLFDERFGPLMRYLGYDIYA